MSAALPPSEPQPTGASARPGFASYWGVVGLQLKKNETAMAALRVVVTLLVIAIVSPLLSMNVPFIWIARSPSTSVTLPLLDGLFNRFLYPGGVDVFFNLILVVGPFWFLAGRVSRPGPAAGARWDRAFLRPRSLTGAALVGGGLVLLFVEHFAFPSGVLAGLGWCLLLVPLAWAGRAMLLVTGAALLILGPATAGWLFLALALPLATCIVMGILLIAAAGTGLGPLPYILALVALPGVAAIVLSRQGALGALGRTRLRVGLVCGAILAVAFTLLQVKFQETKGVKDWRAMAAEASVAGTAVALFPPSPFHPDNIGETGTDSIARSLKVPGGLNFLGCDGNGRDVASRMIFGARISMTIGLVGVSIFILIGVFLGSVAGYRLGKVDMFISRAVEVMICFPTLFLLLTIIAVFDSRSIFLIMFSIGLVGWPGVSRLVRGEFLRQRGLDYVTAAVSQGVPEWRVIFGHVLPNCLGPVLVSATLGIASAILTESSLAFLGLGDPNAASWGQMLATGRTTLLWHLILVPGFAIFLVVTVFNLLGEGLRDALDPKLRR